MSQLNFTAKGYCTFFFAKLPQALRKGALNVVEGLQNQSEGILSVFGLPAKRLLIPGLITFAHMMDFKRDQSSADNWCDNNDIALGHTLRTTLGGMAAVGVAGGLIALPVMASSGWLAIVGTAAATIYALPAIMWATCTTMAVATGVAASAVVGVVSALTSLPQGAVNTLNAVMGKTAPAAAVAATNNNAAPAVAANKSAADIMIERIKNEGTPAEKKAFQKKLREEFPDWFQKKQAPAAPKQTEFTTPSLNIDATP